MPKTIQQTEAFRRWLSRLRDSTAKALIAARTQRLARGHYGDARAVGSGVHELRIHVGPGYRVYFTERGGAIIVLLCGGDKSTQDRDIVKAIELAGDI